MFKTSKFLQFYNCYYIPFDVHCSCTLHTCNKLVAYISAFIIMYISTLLRLHLTFMSIQSLKFYLKCRLPLVTFNRAYTLMAKIKYFAFEDLQHNKSLIKNRNITFVLYLD